MQSILIYQFGKGFLLHPNFRNEDGMWFASEPFRYLPISTLQTELATTATQVLATPAPATVEWYWPVLRKEFLKTAKARSDREFHNGAKLVAIYRSDDGSIELQPHINRGLVGPNRGYYPLTDSIVRLAPGVPASEFANAINEALSAAV